MKIHLFFCIWILNVLAVPWDSSNVVIAYYNNDDSTCDTSNVVKLDVRSATECYQDAYTQYQCNQDGTITYTQYMNDTCDEVEETGNFNPDDMGCQLFGNNSEVYYRFYCYNNLPSSIDPYTSEGHNIFPYVESIFNDRGDSENCTGNPSAWELYRPNNCYSDFDEDPVMWESIDDSQWNIREFYYNDTECSEPEVDVTLSVSDGLCDAMYGFEATYNAETGSPTPRPTDALVVSFEAEFETDFELTGFPCDELEDLQNDLDAVGAMIEAGYANAGDTDITVVVESVETVGDSCSDNSRRLLQDSTDLIVTYTTYCSSQNTCVDLEEDTTGEFLEETLVEEMVTEFNIEDESFGVDKESVTTSAVMDSNGDTVAKNNKSSNNNDDLDGGAVAGIVIAVVVFVAALGALLFWYYRRTENNKGYAGKEIQLGDQTNMNQTLMDDEGDTTTTTTGGSTLIENDDLL